MTRTQAPVSGKFATRAVDTSVDGCKRVATEHVLAAAYGRRLDEAK